MTDETQGTQTAVKAPVICTCSTGSPTTCRRHRHLYSPNWIGYSDEGKDGE
jgi:hypothetical protein